MDEAQQIESSKFYDFLDWAHRNRQKIIVGAGALIALGVFYGISVWRQGENEIAANKALLALPGAGVAAPAAGISAKPFLEVAADFSGTAAGLRAELLGARELFNAGNYTEAQTVFERVAGEARDVSLGASAAFGVAAALDAQGKRTEASAKYQAVITGFPEDAVAPLAKLALGRIHEAEGRHAQAFQLYEELARAGQFDPWAAEASERRQELATRFPDLVKSLPTMSVPGLPPAGISVP